MRRKLASTVALVALLAVGCGQAQSTRSAPSSGSQRSVGAQQAAPALHAHPQAVEPVAGAAAEAGQPSGAPSSFSVGSGSGAVAQPVSDAQVRQELAASGLSAHTSQAELTPTGLAIAPINAPPAVQNVIDAGNQIAHLPYRFGGGHGTFEDNAYDCSGSLSFVFAAAGLLGTTMTSGELMSWGEPGPGKWITVFANQGHTFMYVAGMRFDTVALAETGTRWSNRPADESNLSSFAVRHPPGL
jgi:cell wall-associated NlpC family hydrolase